MVRKFLFIIVCLAILGCSSDDAPQETQFCDGLLTLGLVINVIDSETNVSVENGIRVIARDGGFEQELYISTMDSLGQTFKRFVGVGNRPGSYRVTVFGEGYDLFTSPQIRVTEREDGCGVETVTKTLVINPTEN